MGRKKQMELRVPQKSKVKVFLYTQTTYSERHFRKAWKTRDKRADVDFLTRAKSKAEAVRKFLKVPCIGRGYSANWVRERTSTSGRKEVALIQDNAVYCFDERKNLLGKYVNGVWRAQR